jgi:hypothetical protein
MKHHLLEEREFVILPFVHRESFERGEDRWVKNWLDQQQV